MPSDSAVGTIRGDFCIQVGRNVIHGSDAVESAEKEIAHWFPEGVTSWGKLSWTILFVGALIEDLVHSCRFAFFFSVQNPAPRLGFMNRCLFKNLKCIGDTVL